MAFSLFGMRKSQATQPPAPTPAPPAPAPAGAPAANPSPLAEMEAAWKTVPTDPKAAPTEQPYFQVDPAKLAASVKNLNFAAQIDPAQAKLALEGDTNALSAVINSAVQQSFQATMLSIPGIVEPALRKAADNATAQVPGLFRQQQLASERSANPVLNDPAVAPIVAALKQNLAAQNPQASSAEIQAKVDSMMLAMAGAISPQAKSPQTKAAEAGDDFSFLLA